MPPASPSLDQPLELVLHIGSGKTGTSSIQRLLRRNRGLLLEHGVLFPSSPGARRHVRFGLSFKADDELVETRPYKAQGHPSPAAFRDTFRDELFAEIEDSRPSTVLISDEALYGSDDASLSRLRSFTDAHARRVRLVCYLRRQDDHLVSRYQQVVKTGETRTLAERTAELDHTKTYDYAARLDTWARLLEPDAFVVRRFERARLRRRLALRRLPPRSRTRRPARRAPRRSRTRTRASTRSRSSSSGSSTCTWSVPRAPRSA